MRWVSCHDAANEAEAQLVVALLERHGVPSRVQPMGTLAVLTMAFGVQVLVSEDDLARARTVLEAERAAEPQAATDAWRCGGCGADGEADLDACWSCGRPRDGSAGPAAWEPEVPAPPDEPGLPILGTFTAGLRLLVAHPLVLAGAVPLLAWDAIATAVGLPGQGFFASEFCAKGTAQLLSLPGDVFFGPLGRGLAITIAAGSVCGVSSWSDALALVGRKLPALMMLAALPIVFVELMFLLAGTVAIVMMPMAIAFLYVAIRLIFAAVAVVVDDVGVVAGLRRSWSITRMAWWRTLGLLIVLGVVSLPISWAPPPFRAVLGSGFDPLIEAVLVIAYLRLAGTEPVDRSMVGHRPPIPAPAV